MDKPSLPHWTRLCHILFQLLFLAVCGYWCFFLPPPGNAVLALGVAAVLMTAWEMKWQHKAVWLALVFFLAFLEHKSLDEERRKANLRETSLWNLAQKTSTDITQTQTYINLLGLKMDSGNAKILEAEKNNNTSLVKQLQATQEETEKQYLLAMTPGIVHELSDLSRSWYLARDKINMDAMSAEARKPGERSAIEEAKNRAIENLNKEYSAKAKAVTITANELRLQLLRFIPSHETIGDKQHAAIFTKAVAGETFTDYELGGMSGYLDMLRNRASSGPVSH